MILISKLRDDHDFGFISTFTNIFDQFNAVTIGQFKVDKKVIYEALAKVAKKYPNRVQIMWSNGSLAIAAE